MVCGEEDTMKDRWLARDWLLVDCNGRPVLGPDGRPQVRSAPTIRAQLWTRNLADGARWRRATAAEAREAR